MDTEGQLTFNDSPLVIKFNESISYINKGEFEKAVDMMEEILKENANFPGIVDAIKSVKFWQNRWLKIMREPLGKEQALALENEWNNYMNYIKSLSNFNDIEKVFISLKILISKKLIKNYVHIYQTSSLPNIDVLKRMAEIFLEIQDYKKAIETLEYARNYRKKDPYILALLGESYAREGFSEKAALVLRDAFLLEPNGIDIKIFKSDLMKNIIDEIKKDGIEDDMILEWIPVYGTILKIFNVKREISPEELEKLVQKTDELEMEYYSEKSINKNILPRLINKYFWLIDYYRLQNVNKEYQRLYLNKLKKLNPEIYKKYISAFNFTLE